MHCGRRPSLIAIDSPSVAPYTVRCDGTQNGLSERKKRGRCEQFNFVEQFEAKVLNQFHKMICEWAGHPASCFCPATFIHCYEIIQITSGSFKPLPWGIWKGLGEHQKFLGAAKTHDLSGYMCSNFLISFPVDSAYFLSFSRFRRRCGWIRN